VLTRRTSTLHDSTSRRRTDPRYKVHPYGGHQSPSELERKFQVPISPSPLNARLHCAGNRWPLISTVASARPIEGLDRAVVWPSLADSGPFPDLLAVVWVLEPGMNGGWMGVSDCGLLGATRCHCRVLQFLGANSQRTVCEAQHSPRVSFLQGSSRRDARGHCPIAVKRSTIDCN
jgi:hypothetical protein